VFERFTLEKSALKDLIDLVDPAKQATPYLKANYGQEMARVSALHVDRVFDVGDDLQFLLGPLSATTECLIFGHAG
jgi:hypothetical protein